MRTLEKSLPEIIAENITEADEEAKEIRHRVPGRKRLLHDIELYRRDLIAYIDIVAHKLEQSVRIVTDNGPDPTVSLSKFFRNSDETRALKEAFAEANIPARFSHGTGINRPWLIIHLQRGYAFQRDQALDLAQKITEREGPFEGRIVVVGE